MTMKNAAPKATPEDPGSTHSQPVEVKNENSIADNKKAALRRLFRIDLDAIRRGAV
jgi:hypothetical protein